MLGPVMWSLLPLRFAFPNYHATYLFDPSPRQVSFATPTLPPETPVDEIDDLILRQSLQTSPPSKGIDIDSSPTGGADLIGGWESGHTVHFTVEV